MPALQHRRPQHAPREARPHATAASASNMDRAADLGAVAPDDGGILARVAASTGFDLGGVDVVADGVAERMDAAGVAIDGDIHVAADAMDGEGRVEPTLLAHEATHVVQQRAQGDASSDGDLEAEADAGAEAALSGAGFGVTGAAGDGAPRRWDWTRWMKECAGWADETTAGPGPLEREEEEEKEEDEEEGEDEEEEDDRSSLSLSQRTRSEAYDVTSKGKVTGEVSVGDGYEAKYGWADSEEADGLSTGTEGSVTAGAIARGGERGVAWGGEVGASESGGKASLGDRTELTDKGVRGHTTGEFGAESEATSGAVKGGFDRGFTVEERPVPETGEVDVVVTVTLGATLGADAKVKGKEASVTLGAEAGLTGSAVYTHRMRPEELAPYRASLDAAAEGAPATGYPELGLLGRLAAVRAHAADMGEAAASAFDAGSARAMAPGDSLEVTLTGEIGASAGATVGKGTSVGAKVSAKESQTRSVKVASVPGADGRPRSEITVRFVDASELEAEASGSWAGADAGGSASRATDAGEAVTFSLDPESADYAQQFAEITAAATADDARRLAADPRFADEASLDLTSSSDDATKATGTVGKGLVGASMTTSAKREDEVHAAHGEVEAKVSGAGSRGVGVEIAGTEIASETSTSAVRGEATSEGMSLDVSEELHGRSITGAGEVESWFGKSSGELLQERLTTSWTSVRDGTRLADRDVRELFSRAADRATWARCGEFFVDTHVAWMVLRDDIVAPVVDPALAAIDEVVAREKAQLDALADFVATYGDEARTTLDDALHHSGGDLGRRFEWPADIADRQYEYDLVHEQAEALPGKLAAGDLAAGHELDGRIQRLIGAISDCETFESPRARIDMLDDLGQLAEEVSLEIGRATGHGPAAGEDAGTLLGETTRLQDLVEDCDDAEPALFERIRSYLPDEQATTWGFLSAELGAAWDRNAVRGVLDETVKLYDAWVEHVLQLRGLYAVHGTDDPAISMAPGAPRTEHEPDVRELDRLWALVDERDGDTSGVSARNRDHQQRYARY